jgi:hypothetical protein
MKSLCEQKVPEACYVLSFMDLPSCSEVLKKACESGKLYCGIIKFVDCPWPEAPKRASKRESLLDALSRKSWTWLDKQRTRCDQVIPDADRIPEFTDSRMCEAGCLTYCDLANQAGTIPADVKALREKCRSSGFGCSAFGGQSETLSVCRQFGGEPCLKAIFPHGLPVLPAKVVFWQAPPYDYLKAEAARIACRTGAKAACAFSEWWDAYEDDVEGKRCGKAPLDCKGYVGSLLRAGEIPKALATAGKSCVEGNDFHVCNQLSHREWYTKYAPRDWERLLLEEYGRLCREKKVGVPCVPYAVMLLGKDKAQAVRLLESACQSDHPWARDACRILEIRGEGARRKPRKVR